MSKSLGNRTREFPFFFWTFSPSIIRSDRAVTFSRAHLIRHVCRRRLSDPKGVHCTWGINTWVIHNYSGHRVIIILSCRLTSIMYFYGSFCDCNKNLCWHDVCRRSRMVHETILVVREGMRTTRSSRISRSTQG